MAPLLPEGKLIPGPDRVGDGNDDVPPLLSGNAVLVDLLQQPKISGLFLETKAALALTVMMLEWRWDQGFVDKQDPKPHL